MQITDKKVCVLGLGITGFEAARFLHRHKAQVFVSEQNMSKDIESYAVRLQRAGIACEIGGHNFSRIKSSDLIVISPGINPRTPLIVALKKIRKKIISEIELAAAFFKGTMIGITGTNGKTTVTTLTELVLKNAGREAQACGNIGNPFIAVVDKLKKDSYAVVELSSFQLYYSRRLRPQIGVVLNIAPDHFDWHTGMPEYARSKCKIFRYQTKSDIAVINYRERSAVEQYIKGIRSKKVYFNADEKVKNANFDCVKNVALALGVPRRVIDKTLREFKGIEHRLEFVARKKNITYINDSKATSPHSLEWALSKFDKKVVLICGGKNKGVSFRPLRESVQKNVKAMIVIGEAQNEIVAALADCVPTERAGTLKEALLQAKGKAAPGETVLFSPACASFDMFKNYEDRGRKFKELVKRV
jgi:UDP-N-acetylmuramoylalanine--D-glutamate ligase